MLGLHLMVPIAHHDAIAYGSRLLVIVDCPRLERVRAICSDLTVDWVWDCLLLLLLLLLRRLDQVLRGTLMDAGVDGHRLQGRVGLLGLLEELVRMVIGRVGDVRLHVGLVGRGVGADGRVLGRIVRVGILWRETGRILFLGHGLRLGPALGEGI